MIDLSKTKAEVSVQQVDKTYEIRFLRGRRLNVLQCTDEVLPSVLSQILKDGHTITKVTLL
jgi:hypothetical protein